MKALLQHKSRLLLMVLTITAASGLWLLLSSHAPVGCSQGTECQSQFNWLSWLQGQSRSSQFHFVDLLELLERMSPAKHDQQ